KALEGFFVYVRTFAPAFPTVYLSMAPATKSENQWMVTETPNPIYHIFSARYSEPGPLRALVG
ncbi:hypothetical protein EBR66_05580, partial [bacterium]|nr:hypothetical protein [bacterium]